MLIAENAGQICRDAIIGPAAFRQNTGDKNERTASRGRE